MSDAREEVLRRVRAALADRPASPPIPRDYRGVTGGRGDLDLFAERVEDYRATVHRVTGAVAETVTRVIAERGITSVVVPDGFPAAWVPTLDIVTGETDTAVLDEVGAVLTTCRVAIAETGTIVLDTGHGMGPRMLTLVPDYHCVVVPAHRIVPGLPDALTALDPVQPMTWISGPSATSDIELDRVEGVHGPRTLDVIVVG